MGAGGKGKKQVRGYRYAFAMHMGLCRGPVDEVVQIRVDNLVAWDGNGAGKDDRDDIVIDRGDLFGGDDKEGGIVGGLSILMGKPTQNIATRGVPDVPLSGKFLGAITGSSSSVGTLPIKNFLTGLVSSFRGMATLFYRGQVCVNNPYPKPWKVRVRRAKKGWQGDDCWYPDKATIYLKEGDQDIYAMNPAHMLYECHTNKAWGRGWPVDVLDLESFTSAANQLCAEGFGLCLRWTRTNSLSEFIQSIINHVNGALYVSRETGLITFRLIRDDYDHNSIPTFDSDSGLLGIEDDQKSSPDDSANEIVVKFRSPIDDTERSVRAQSLAGYQAAGAIKSTQTDYPGVPTTSLALRVAERDLIFQAAGLRRLKVRLDRSAWRIAPGSVFAIREPSRGIDFMVLRAGRVEDSSLTSGEITITAVEDVFSMPSTSFTSYQNSQWEPPDRSAVIPENRRLIEASYRDWFLGAGASEVGSLPDDAATFLALAEQPTPLSIGYAIYSAATGETMAFRANGSWVPRAVLSAGIGPGDTTISFSSLSNGQYVEDGEAVMIDNEVMLLSDFDPAGTATIGRGCLDTVPVAHAPGSVVWFIDSGASTDERDYAAGETVAVKLLTRTSAEVLPLDAAPEDTITLDHRFFRPYPPGKLEVNGDPFWNIGVITADVVFTWTTRNRVSQQDQLLAHEEASVPPEAGTTYTFRVYDDADTLLRTQSGLTGTTWTYTTAMIAADGSPTAVRVEVESVRDGYASWQHYDFTVSLSGGFDFDFDFNFDGG